MPSPEEIPDATRRRLDRAFLQLTLDPDISVRGSLRITRKGGAADVWVRRGPILLRGSGYWRQLYALVPPDAEVVINRSGECPTAIDVTREAGPWFELFVIEATRIPDEVVTAIRRLSDGARERRRIDLANDSVRVFREKFGRGTVSATVDWGIITASR